MSGILYLVATPIGNLQDITLRALETLKNVDIIACEDTRHTLGLLNHYEIKKPLISYYKGKEHEGSEKIIELLVQDKNVALVSDAGMPCISDPGSILVNKVIEHGIKYTVIPGACAFVSAATLVGLEGSFTFIGFLPEKKKDKDKLLKPFINTPSKLIFYAAPHDINRTLNYLYETLGNRKVYLVKEITKMFENVIQGFLESLQLDNPKGEFVIIVDEAKIEKKELTDEEIKEELLQLLSQGIDKKQAIVDMSKKYEISKNIVYKLAIDL
jgi:16S rRNA (cytidine1402-2'-O)-methyltransferase